MGPVQMCCYLLLIVGVIQAVAATSPPVEPLVLNATCPSVEPKDRPVCPDECTSDDDCQFNRICCTNECGGRTCSDSVEFCQSIQCDIPFCGKGVQPLLSPFSCCPFCPSSRNETCPNVGPSSDDNCPDECVTDDHCPSNMICCANGCGGHVCSHSNEFCKSIACAEPFCGEGVQPITSPFRCCPFCPPTPPKTCPSVEPMDRPVCPDECTSDDDCQFGRICCTNECGGRTCSDSVEFCQSIQCDIPFCGEGVQPLLSPFSCCPFCPPSQNETCPNVGPSSDDNCPDECVTDDHCPSNMICCANGCGGHVCSHSNEFCKSIACFEPICEDGASTITSPFRCCPFCPPSCEVTGNIKRKGRKVITTFSTEHPDVTFQCKCGRRRRFRPCISPLKFRARSGVHSVMVEAECPGVTTSKLFTIRVR